MRGSMRMAPAASMMKVGKWAIMGLSQPKQKASSRREDVAAAGALRRHPAQGVSPFASTWRRNSPKLTPQPCFRGSFFCFCRPDTTALRQPLAASARQGRRHHGGSRVRPYRGLEPKTE
jgi:hypothetical protein